MNKKTTFVTPQDLNPTDDYKTETKVKTKVETRRQKLHDSHYGYAEYDTDNIYYQYMMEIRNSKDSEHLKAEDEKKNIEKMTKGDIKARNKLICANLHYVVKIAQKYTWSKVPFIDLIAAGNLGLTLAAEKYDCTKGVAFRPYAKYLIMNEMQKLFSTKKRQAGYTISYDEDRGKDMDEDKRGNNVYNELFASRDYCPDWGLRQQTMMDAIRMATEKDFFKEAANFFADYIKMKLEGYELAEVAKKYGLTERKAKEIVQKITKTCHFTLDKAA